MKKTRKGFTLVELLIVVAILGALAAIMTVSSGSSIAKARATAIANNLRICTTAAQLYYLSSGDVDTAEKDIGSVKTSEFVATIPNFSEFSSGTIAYVASNDDEAGYKKWGVKVTISGADKTEILTALKAVKGFSTVDTSKNVIYYKVFDGTIQRSEASS